MPDAGRTSRLPASIKALRHRDFRRVTLGNFISSLGTWSSMVGIGWAARSLTDSPQAITLAFAVQFLPNLFFAPFGGMLADRFDRRRITIIGNFAMALPAAAIGLLLTTDRLTLTWLLTLAFVGGIATSFTNPASQALVPSLVPENEVQFAVSLASATLHSSRLVGAAMAGVIISLVGTSAVFYWNAVSFLAVVGAWMLVQVVTVPRVKATESLAGRLAGGLRYARLKPTVRILLVLNIVMAVLAMHTPLLPLLVKDVLHANVSTYASLQMGAGVGAMAGALLAGQWTTDERRRRAMAMGMAIDAAAMLGISFSRWVPATVVLQVVFGAGFYTTSTVAQSMIMMATENAYLGRVMALYQMALAGMLPVNALLAGLFASHLGIVTTIGAAGVALFSYATWFSAFHLRQVGVDAPHDVVESNGEAGQTTRTAEPIPPSVSAYQTAEGPDVVGPTSA